MPTISTGINVTLGEWRTIRASINNHLSNTPCTYADLVNMCIDLVYEIAVELGASSPFDIALNQITIADGKKCVTYQELIRTESLIVRIYGINGLVHQYKFSGEIGQFPKLTVDDGSASHIKYSFNSIVALDSVGFEPITKDIRVRFQNVNVPPHIYLVSGNANSGYCTSVEVLPRYEDFSDPHDVWIRMKNGIRIKLKFDIATTASASAIYSGNTEYYTSSLSAYNSDYGASINAYYTNYNQTVHYNNDSILDIMKSLGVELDIVPINGQGEVTFVGVTNRVTNVYVATDGHIIIRNLSGLSTQVTSYEQAKNAGSSVVYPPVRNGSTTTNINNPTEILLAVISQGDDMYDRYFYKYNGVADWLGPYNFKDSGNPPKCVVKVNGLNINNAYTFEFKAMAVYKPKTITIVEYMNLKLYYKNAVGTFTLITDVEKTPTQWKHKFQTEESTSGDDSQQTVTLLIVAERGVIKEEYWDKFQVINGEPKEYAAIKVSMNNGVNGVAAAITKPTTTLFTVPSLTYKHPTVMPNKLSLYLRPVKKVTLSLRVYKGCSIEINGRTFSTSNSYEDFDTFIDNEALDSNNLEFVVTRTSNTFNFVDPKVLYGKNALGHSTNYQNVIINRLPEKLETQNQCNISIKNINVMQSYVSIDIQLKKTLTMNLNMSWVETISQINYLAVSPSLGKGMYLSIMKQSNQSGWDGIAVVKSDTTTNAETFESKAVRVFDNNTNQFKYSFEVNSRQIAFYLRTMPTGTTTQDTEYIPSNAIKKVEFYDARDYSIAQGYPSEMTIANESFTILNLGWFKIEPDMTKDEINVNLKVTKYPTHTVIIDITKIKQTWATVQNKFGMTLDLIGADNSKHRQEPETDTDSKQIYKFLVPDVWPSSSYPRRFKFQLTSPSTMSPESEIVKYNMTVKWGSDLIISSTEKNAGFVFDSNDFIQVRSKLNTATATSNGLTYSITPIEGEPRMKLVFVDVWTGVPNGGTQGNGWDRYTSIPNDFIICPTGENDTSIINVYLDCQYYSADDASIEMTSNLLYSSESNSPVLAKCVTSPYSNSTHIVTILHRFSDFYSFNLTHSTGKVWSNQSCNLDIKYLTGSGEQRGFYTLNFHIGTIGKIHLSPSDTSHSKPEAGGYFVINCKTTTFENPSGNNVVETSHYYNQSPTVFYLPTCDKPSVLNHLIGPVESGGPDKLKYTFTSDPGVQSAVITFKVGIQNSPWYSDISLPISVSNFMSLVHERYNHGNGFVENTHQISTVLWPTGMYVAEFCFYCPTIATDGGDLYISGRLIDLGLVIATKQRVTETDYNYIIRLTNNKSYYDYNTSARLANRVTYNEANPFTVEYRVGSEKKQDMLVNTVCGPVMKVTLTNQSGNSINKTIGSQWKFNAYIEVWNSNNETTKYKAGEFLDFRLTQECTWSDGSSTDFNTYFNTETTVSSDVYTTTVIREVSNPMTISTRIVSSTYSEFNTNPLKTTVTGFLKYINIYSNDPNDRNKTLMLCAAQSGRNGSFYTYNSTGIPDDVKFTLDDYDSYRGVYYATFKVVQDSYGFVRLYRIKKNSYEALIKFAYGWDFRISRPESWHPSSYMITAGEHSAQYAGMERTCFSSGYSEYGTFNKLTAYFTSYKAEEILEAPLQNLETHTECHFYMLGAHGGTYYLFKNKPMSFSNPLPTQTPICRYYVNWGLTSSIYSEKLDDYPMWEFPKEEMPNQYEPTN